MQLLVTARKPETPDVNREAVCVGGFLTGTGAYSLGMSWSLDALDRHPRMLFMVEHSWDWALIWMGLLAALFLISLVV